MPSLGKQEGTFVAAFAQNPPHIFSAQPCPVPLLPKERAAILIGGMCRRQRELSAEPQTRFADDCRVQGDEGEGEIRMDFCSLVSCSYQLLRFG